MKILELVNTIRDNGTVNYQERVPEATADNIEEYRNIMLGDDLSIPNEFMSTLLNKVVKSVMHTKIFKNPLSPLKKGKKPLGDTIEEIYNNFIKAQTFDGNGNTTALLGRNLPDTKTVYHVMNRKDKYPVTVSRERLAKAFTSWAALESYVNNTIIATLYNSAELDEFIHVKRLIKAACDNNAARVVPVPDPLLSKTNAEEYIKIVKTISGLMVFPSDKYNGYLTAQDKDTKPIITFSNLNEQVLVLDVATSTTVDVDVLASSFNMSVADFNKTKKIIIDHFDDPDIRGALLDDAFFQIYDDLITIGTFYNGESLYTNYWLHVWQTLAYSILVNAVVFKVAKDENNDGDVAKHTVTYSLGNDIKSSNKRKTVYEGATFSTTLSGTISSVTVTMGGIELPDAYDDTTGNIEVDVVTGDIVVTAS